ncbi:MAG: signal peptidase II [Streptosporangiaceae bacterium]
MQAARGTPLTGPAGGRSPGLPGRPDDPSGGPSRPRRVGVLLGVALCVLALDIISKVIVVATLTGRPPVRLLGGFLTLREDRNPGAAFSIGTSMTVVFSAIAIGVIVFILRASRRIRSLPWAVALGLLLGGATGNLTDRLLRYPGPLRGYVVDWIQVPHWPVFNLADSAIVCGGILAVLLSVRGTGIDGRPHGDHGPRPAADDQAGPGTAADRPACPARPDSALAGSGPAAEDQPADGQPEAGGGSG